MKVDLGQNVRLVVLYGVSSFRCTVMAFCHVVSSIRLFDMSFRRFIMVFRRFGTPILLGPFGELPVRFVGSSRLSFRLSFRRFVMPFRRFDSSTQKGYNSTYIT